MISELWTEKMIFDKHQFLNTYVYITEQVLQDKGVIINNVHEQRCFIRNAVKAE